MAENMTLSLRIQTELSQARADLQSFSGGLVQAGQSATQAAGAMEQAARTAQQITSAAQQASTATQSLYTAQNQLHSASVSAGNAATAAGQATITGAQATTAYADAASRAGITIGQYQQAMRQLPMQLQDIGVSLASGMPLWMTLTQQVPQITQSFGGASAALRAMASVITPTRVALGGLATTAAVLYAAYQTGRHETDAYNQALILTGNTAGTTTDELAKMAERLDSGTATQHQAAAALAEIAASGKIAADQMEQVAAAAIAMENATGKAVSQTVAEFVALQEKPVEASAKLNEQYGYLTAAIFQQIEALNQQGKTSEAARIATEALSRAEQQRAADIEQSMGPLDRLARSISKAFSDMWDSISGIGRPDPDADLQRIDLLTQKVAYLKSTLGSGFEPANVNDLLSSAQSELDNLQRKNQSGADEKAAVQAVNDLRVKALANLDAETTRTKKLQQLEQQRANALKGQGVDAAAIERDYASAVQAVNEAYDNQDPIRQRQRSLEQQRQNLQHLSETQKAQLLLQKEGIPLDSEKARTLLADASATDQATAAEKARTEAERSAQQAARQSAQQAAQRLRQQQSYIEGLTREANTLGMTAEQLRQYELAEQGLNSGQQAAAQAQLQRISQYEREQQAIKNSQTNTGLQAQLLQATGQTAAAALVQVRAQLDAQKTEFAKTGNTIGITLIDQLIPLQEAKTRIDEIKAQIQQLETSRSQQGQSINIQQDAGLLTQVEARRQLLDLDKQTNAQIEQLLPEMRQLAQITGNTEALNYVRELELRLEKSKIQADELGKAFKDGVTNGIKTALQGLRDGTLNPTDALLSIANSIATSISDKIIDNLAEQAYDSLIGIGDSLLGSTASQTASQALQGTTEASTMAEGISTGGTAAATSMATSIETGGTTAAASLTTGIETGGSTAATTIGQAMITAGNEAAATIAAAMEASSTSNTNSTDSTSSSSLFSSLFGNSSSSSDSSGLSSMLGSYSGYQGAESTSDTSFGTLGSSYESSFDWSAASDAISSATSEGASELGSSILSASETGSTSFSSTLSSAFSSGSDLFSGMLDSAGSMFSGIFDSLGSSFSGLFDSLGSLLSSGGSAVSGLFSSGSSALSSLFSFGAEAATGGLITGPGTGTSDSIAARLSNGEFVTRQAVVSQPGALSFLHDFNANGMDALSRYSPVHHATGGLAGIPAPEMPAPLTSRMQLADSPGKASTTVQNSQNFYLVDDPNRIGSVLRSKTGVESMIVALSSDPARFRSILGIS